jgi:hypothetical protein
MTDRAGRTELHHAALEGNGQRITELLDQGADVSATDSAGWNPAALRRPGTRRPDADPDRCKTAGISSRAGAARIANHDVAQYFEGR